MPNTARLRTGHCLYRHYAKTGELLYVGITVDPLQRWSAHSREKEWAEQVSRIELQWFEKRWQALTAERDAIRDENPRWNATRVTPYVPTQCDGVAS